MTSEWKASAIEAKAARAGITEQRQGGTRSSRPRPIVVEHRASGAYPFGPREWHQWRKYRTELEANAAMHGAKRKYNFYEFRIRP